MPDRSLELAVVTVDEQLELLDAVVTVDRQLELLDTSSSAREASDR